MELESGQVERLLADWPVARLATLRPDGTPHLVPIVFVRLGERLWTPVDGKPKGAGELQRLRNVRHDARVAVLLDEYGADWSALWWIRVDGRAEIVTAAAPDADPTVGPVARALRAKYPEYAHTPLFHGEPTLLAIHIAQTRSWRAA